MPSESPLISIVVPVFNESATLVTLIEKVRDAMNACSHEIVIVDDGSSDGTADLVAALRGGAVRAIRHAHNKGKGASLRTALENVKGEIVVIQDADLEYDPHDIPSLVQPIRDGHADVVFGSRFRGKAQRVQMFWHRLANGWLTSFSNMVNNLDLSDMETGYKAFRKNVLDKIQIRENRFGVEPELTAKVAKLKCRIYEVPISYHGRDYSRGKKIGLLDGVRAAWCIVRYRVTD
ncbi:MAG TPA: glycosyltransferase family 2 protein [Lacipirellulaceae bacterium]|nr:glycosyltransferase family 2 protein [Lacipirellulaceae bacterium]